MSNGDISLTAVREIQGRKIEQRTNTACLATIATLSDDLENYGYAMTNKQRAAMRTAIHALQSLASLTR